MKFLSTLAPRAHQARSFQDLQVLHYSEARHRQLPLQCAQSLPVPIEEPIEQTSTGRDHEGLEYGVHLFKDR